MVNTYLDLFEDTRAGYLAAARKAANKYLDYHETITSDIVRQLCPPPENINAKVLGAVFHSPEFVGTGTYIKSKVPTSHGRAIQIFRRRSAKPKPVRERVYDETF